MTRPVTAVLVVCGLLLCSGCDGGKPASASRASALAPYRIGLLVSQTGAGDLYGPQQVKSTRLAVRDVNAAGGVDGHPLELVVRDDRSDPAVGTRAMRELIADERVVAVIGPTLSIVAVSADPVADALRTPVLAVSNTADGIVGDCSYPCTWIWRDSLAERVAVRANVDAYVKDEHPGTALTVQTRDDVLGTAGVTNAVAAFRRAGVRVAGQLQLAQDESMTQELRDALARKPGVLFVGTTYGAFAAALMEAVRAQGYTGAFLGGNIFNSEQTRKLAGTAGVGARSGAAWWSGNGFPANAEFITAYRQAFGEEPDQFAAQGYVGVQILADALDRADAGNRPIAEQRAAVQRSLADVAISTVLGPFRFTESHDVDQIAWVLAMTRGGHRLVGFCDPSC